MRKKEIKCPYCGSKAKLVHFYDIYGKDATHPERYAWACARFPQCDSYVSTIKGSFTPLSYQGKWSKNLSTIIMSYKRRDNYLPRN